MQSTSNRKTAQTNRVRLGLETWAAIRKCYEEDPDISAFDAAALVCKQEHIDELPSPETLRSRVRRNGWKKRISRTHITSLAERHADMLEPDPVIDDRSRAHSLTAENAVNVRGEVLARHRRDLRRLNDQLDAGLAIVFEASGVVNGKQVNEANPEMMKLGYGMIRATNEVVNGKNLLVKAEREAYGLNKGEDKPVTNAVNVAELDAIYENVMKKVEENRLMVQERSKRLNQLLTK